MKKISNQRGFAFLEIIFILAVLGLVGFLIFRAVTTKPVADNSSQGQPESPTSQAGPLTGTVDSCDESTGAPDGTFGTTEMLSSDGSYTVVLTEQPATNPRIDLKVTGEKFVACDLPTTDEQEAIGLGSKYPGQYGITFDGWSSNTRFRVKVVTAGGDEFSYEIDATTGKLDTKTYKKLN